MIKVRKLETPAGGHRSTAEAVHDSVPLVHYSAVETWVDFLSSIGADVAGGMARAKLPAPGLGTSGSYVPCKALCSWAAHEGRTRRIDNIGLRVADRAGVNGLPPGLIATVAQQATLLDGLRAFCEEVGRASSQVQIWLMERPEAVYVCHRGSFDRSVDGQVELTWWTLGSIVHLIRLFLGRRWRPAMMGVPAQTGAGAFARETFPKTRFVGEQERAWVTVPLAKLGESAQSLCRFPEGDLPEPPRGFVGSLRYAMQHHLPNGPPKIGMAAEIAGTSVRTLQRRLDSYGSSYSRVVDEARLSAATELLRDPATKVIDVAFETGYADPAHFSRAFRRLAGVSPKEYRAAAIGRAVPGHLTAGQQVGRG